MFKNYLLIAFRNFGQEKFYTALNIAGLAMGLVCAIFIGLWINDELSYDKHFKNHDRIYRIECSLVTEGVPSPMTSTDRRTFNYLRQNHSDVCDVVAVFRTPTLLITRVGSFYEEQAFYADSTLFDVFSFDFIAGDPGTALSDSSSVVITERMSRALFAGKNPIGDTIWYSNHQTKTGRFPRVVTAVIKENLRTSHFHPGVIFSKRRNMEVFEVVYISLHSGYTPGYFIDTVWKPFYKTQIRPNYIPEKQDMVLDRLQPLSDIHLGGNKWEDFEVNSDISAVFIFAGVGLLILVLACINYINLATARSFNRSREIAVRKVLGASRQKIIIQFLVETFLVTLIALVIALSLAEMLLPFFNDLADKQVSLYAFKPGMILWLILLILVVGLISGTYPAFFVSSFSAAEVMKDVPTASAFGKVRMRQVLIVIQFCISMIMLIATITIKQQLSFVKSRNLGFDSDKVLLIDLNDEKVYADQELVKHALLQHANILKVSATHNTLGGKLNRTYINFETAGGMKSVLINSLYVDHDFADVMGLDFIEGQNFPDSMIADSAHAAIIINKSAAKFLNYETAIGKRINGGMYYGGHNGSIVGVVNDFHAVSLHTPIKPLALVLGTLGRPEGKSKFLMVKVKSADFDNTIKFIERTYKAYGQGYPFHFTFLDEKFNAQYQREEKQMLLFNGFAAISLFTSLLGLIGLATFFMKHRSKEISIRRISGASVREIIYLLSKDYIRLVVVAWLIACPLGYIVMQQWLTTFAYHITQGSGPFLVAGYSVFAIVLITVILQALIVIKLKPADVLRYE